MLDIKYIRENTELVKTAAKNKGYDVNIERLLVLDKKRKELSTKIEDLRTEQNKLNRGLKGKPSTEIIAKSKDLREKIDALTNLLGETEPEYTDLLLKVPAVPSEISPIGEEEKNKEIKKIGEPKKFSFPILDHVDLGIKHNLLDIEAGVKIGGTRAYVLKNELVILEQSLLRYTMDQVRKEGFEVMNVPVLVKEDVLFGSGFFPFQKEDVYQVNEDNLYLVGTSEASLVSYHSNETLGESQLPRLLSGISACFRKEVGTYGKDNRGIVRVHQFNKVEQVVLCLEEDWEKMFNFILQIAERIVTDLGLPYRIIEIATGDMGAKNVRQNDLEVWFAAQGKYRETHSCSYLGDYQARRANIKYRDESGEKRFVHTLNNTAIATPRILGAILEYYQREDGSIEIPEVLRPYTGFDEIK